ncbi:MAG: glycosyltransferase family 4 protein [Gammaproteobacteria bacterium]
MNGRPVYRWLRINGRAVYRWLRINGRAVYRWLRIALYRLNAVFDIVGLSKDVSVEIMRFKPDVIHAHDLATLPIAAQAATAVGAKIVYDAHELERHRNGLNFLGRVSNAIIEARSIHKADRVITVCGSIADFLAATYKIMRPAVVMNAPDPSEQHTVPRTIRDSIGLKRDIPLAVYVGNVTFGRGLEKSVEALQHCKEFHLALLGPRVASVEQELLDLAGQRGVLDRVHVLDSVSPHDVVPYIISADVGVIPIQDVCLSYRFCLPNKIFEMTFAGIPVCVSDLPEMRAFVESERTGLIMDQTDPKDIARAMREAYRDRHQLRATGDRLERIKKRYSWSTQVEQLLSVYRDLSARPS